MHKAFLLGAALTAAHLSAAQAVERILVETYAETVLPDGRTLHTYRIHVDLAPRHQLQMVYGDEHHPLWIRTTTTFFNDTVNGAAFADRIDADRLGRFPLALDSWLSLGAASDAHSGVPLARDIDGSVLECPPYAGPVMAARTPLCIADGLVRDTLLKEITAFNFTAAALNEGGMSEVRTDNGAWAVLGGARSVLDDNTLLIAQVSTTGELSFLLNLQVAAPGQAPVKHVASDAREGEVLLPAPTFLR